jgi:MFS family permease
MTLPSRTSPAPRIIALSLFLYRCLLKLAPGAFRRDYTLQALQDFHQCCFHAYRERGSLGVLILWPLLFGEAVTGLLAEYLSEIFGRKRPMLPTIRRSMIAAFGAFVLFMLAYIALGRIADPSAPFDNIGRAYPQVGIAHSLLAYSGDIALLAIVLGGLPILFTAVSHAIRRGPGNVLKLFVIRPKHTLMLLGASLIITICFLGYLLGTQYLFGPPPCTQTNGCVAGLPPLLLILGFAAIIALITALVFVILAIMASLSLAVLRSEFSIELLRFSLVPVAVLALTMFAATLSATVWLVSLWVLVPQFAASGSGLGYGQTAWVIAIIAAMTLATLITIGAFGSGLKASRIREA